MSSHNASRGTDIRNLRTHQTQWTISLVLIEAPERIDNISDTALHTFRNHYRDDSPSPKTTSSTTFTASYTHRVIETSSQTIYPK